MERRFSLEDDFMDFHTNDLLYAFMKSLSTSRPVKGQKEKRKEYLTCKEFSKNKRTIAGVCGVSTRTIERNVQTLIENGLLELGIEHIKKNNGEWDYSVYYFPYDYDGRYQMVDYSMLKYLVETRNSQAIRVYIYLLNKYQWKKDYTFTIKEIKTAMGYAEYTKTADEMIRNILKSFAREGILDIEKVIEMEDVGTIGCNIVPVERMKLKYIALNEHELRPVAIDVE